MNKQTQAWMKSQDEWVKEIDPRLRLSHSDCRCGNKFAIVNDTSYGAVNVLTDFMTRQEWYIFRNAINLCGEQAFREGIQKRIID